MDKKEKLDITFLCVTHINDIIITGGEDGYLYFWDRVRIIKKFKAHEHSAIFCLKASVYKGKSLISDIFVSGGMYGQVNLFLIKNTEDLKDFSV